jgi:hypothetical protein
MGRAKEAAADAFGAVSDSAAAAASQHAYTAPSGRAESLKSDLSPPRRAARLPSAARFALAVVLSFALSSLGRSFVDHWSNNEVGSITREANSTAELSVLAAWRLYVLVCFGLLLASFVMGKKCKRVARPPFQLRAEEADTPFSSSHPTNLVCMAGSGSPSAGTPTMTASILQPSPFSRMAPQ